MKGTATDDEAAAALYEPSGILLCDRLRRRLRARWIERSCVAFHCRAPDHGKRRNSSTLADGFAISWDAQTLYLDVVVIRKRDVNESDRFVLTTAARPGNTGHGNAKRRSHPRTHARRHRARRLLAHRTVLGKNLQELIGGQSTPTQFLSALQSEYATAEASR